MPYNYTPSPVYTSPVQLASDGDPASSATIMGPIEAALDNVAAVYQLGPRTLPTVASLEALAARTGMQHGDIVLVASQASGDPDPINHLGLFRFDAGYSAGGTLDIWRVEASDASGVWICIDDDRRDVALGYPTLDEVKDLTIGQGGTRRIRAGVTRRIQLLDTGEEGRLLVEGSSVLLQQAGTDSSQLLVTKGCQIGLGTSSDPLTTPGGLFAVYSGQGLDSAGLHITSTGAMKVLTGGQVRVDSGAEVDIQAGGMVTLSGELEVSTGGILSLKERIRHEVIRYAAVSGTTNVTASTADEHLIGTAAAGSVFVLADPTANGQRVRFSRTSLDSAVATGIVSLTVNGVAAAYLLQLSGTGSNHVRWIEFTSAPNGSLVPTWYPSAYAMT